MCTGKTHHLQHTGCTALRRPRNHPRLYRTTAHCSFVPPAAPSRGLLHRNPPGTQPPGIRAGEPIPGPPVPCRPEPGGSGCGGTARQAARARRTGPGSGLSRGLDPGYAKAQPDEAAGRRSASQESGKQPPALTSAGVRGPCRPGAGERRRSGSRRAAAVPSPSPQTGSGGGAKAERAPALARAPPNPVRSRASGARRWLAERLSQITRPSGHVRGSAGRGDLPVQPREAAGARRRAGSA